MSSVVRTCTCMSVCMSVCVCKREFSIFLLFSESPLLFSQEISKKEYREN